MIRRIDFSGRPPAHPLLNALAIAGGALVFAALVLFSLLAFLVVTGVIALLAAVVGLRVWWQRRRHGAATIDLTASGRVIEGEFRRVPPRGEGERDGR